MSDYAKWPENELRRQIEVTEHKVIAGVTLPAPEITALADMKKALFARLKERKREQQIELVGRTAKTVSTLTRAVAREI